MPLHRLVTVSRVFARSKTCNFVYPYLNHSRQLSISRILLCNGQQSKIAIKKEKEKFRTFIIQRYMKYVQNYTKVIENRFPVAMKMYRVFSVGIMEFYQDLKKYISLRIKVAKDRNFEKMTRQEIELYQKMPTDMLRIAPVLILSAIPFGNYLIFPLAFMMPRALLCSHFWSIQQKAEFSVLDMKDRLHNNRPVFRSLQAKINSIPDNLLVKAQWTKVIGQLGSGVHPTVQDICQCKQLFDHGPYSLDNLSYSHKGQLLNMHGLKKALFPLGKLKYRAFMLREMDKAIIREGGVDALTTESLRYACNLRGLNSTHLSNQDMARWLNQWLQVSIIVDKNSYSLLLHCPIFFGYNHPQNWVLIY